MPRPAPVTRRRRLGVEPGREFRVAFEAAMELVPPADVILIDRPVCPFPASAARTGRAPLHGEARRCRAGDACV